jgi:3-hydroxy-3-methylglutaryl CoA synthase
MNNADQEIPTNMDGWDWFKKAVDHANNAAQKQTGLSQQDIDYAFEKCFKTPSGKIVLEYLQTFQDKVQDFDPSLGFYNGASYGFWRSGQKSIIQFLKTKARGAKQ